MGEKYDYRLHKMRVSDKLRAGAGVDVSNGTVSVITPPEGIPYVAGVGTEIEGATIHVKDIPMSEVDGLTDALAGKQAVVSAGHRVEITSGSTVGVKRYMQIENVSGASVTLMADHAYKINAISSAVTLNAESIPADEWGLEGHAEIFVAGAGYVVTGNNVYLANPLEPDAVNNCTLRFHNGECVISVEDHVYGYVVTSISGMTSGTLPYGITSATSNYIAFDATTNGSAIDLGGSTASAEKHIVGNGYNDTILTGAVDCGTSKFTVANLSLQNVVVNGGTMTLGDAFIPSGSTVAVSGGGLAVEKVSGNGGVIDLGYDSATQTGGTHIEIGKSTMIANGVTFSGGSGNYGGAIFNANSTGIVSCVSCVFSGNNAGNRGGAVYVGGLINSFKGCSFLDNTALANYGLAAYVGSNATLKMEDCTLATGQTVVVTNGTNVELAGSNAIAATVLDAQGNSTGSVTLTSGAILDLTGNSAGPAYVVNGATVGTIPINPGGGITIGSDVQIYPSAGSASAVEISGGTFGSITNGGVLMGPVRIEANGVVGGNATVDVSSYLRGDYFTCSGLTFVNPVFRAIQPYVGQSDSFISCSFVGNGTHINGFVNQGIVTFLDCSFESGFSIACQNDCSIILEQTNRIEAISPYSGGIGTVTISSGASINLTSSINPGGTGGITVLTGGCTVNGNAIAAGTYTSIDSTGTPT